MHVPDDGQDWVDIDPSPLPVEAALAWAGRPDCGGVVLFSGTVRNHAEGRPGVSVLEYEAYLEAARARLGRIAAQVRTQWPEVGRVVLLHRTGRLAVGDVAVVVVVSAPHRGEAFAAAQWAIDTIKTAVPIWKKETWDGGSDWGTGARDVMEVTR
jgi:molybdopterin synthase catalytic subunit